MAMCIILSDLIVYGVKQASGQLSILMNTCSVKEVLNSKELSQEEKAKLLLIDSVKKFSVAQLAYKPSSSYTTYYDQRKGVKLWVVSASEPWCFNAYTWYFPIVGEVSYKGFFDSNAAKKEFTRLQKAGYDADVGQVGAWSTLGIFSDPVLSDMLKKKKGKLVNLIFHELFHSTYYAPGTVEINENLANFVAHKATLQFLRNDTAALHQYTEARFDDSLNTAFILRATTRLDSLYKTFDLKDSLTCFHKKKLMLEKIYEQSEQLPFKQKSRYSDHHLEILSARNAFFMQYKRYDALYDSLERVLKENYHNQLQLMIRDLKE